MACLALVVLLCLAACVPSDGSATAGATPTSGATGTGVPSPAPSSSAGTDATAAPGEDQDLSGGLDGGDMGAELLDPVPLDAAVPLGGAEVSVTSLDAVDGGGDAPGDLAGPAVAVTVSVTNTSVETLDLSEVVVDLQGADHAPFPPLASGSEALPTEVAAGGTVRGTWVFSVPEDARTGARVLVDLGATTDTAVLQGDLPPA